MIRDNEICPPTTIEFTGCDRRTSSIRRWKIAHRSTGSINEAEAYERQDTTGISGSGGHEREKRSQVAERTVAVGEEEAKLANAP